MTYDDTITEWAKAARAAVMADVKVLARDCHANIVLATPIDTGRAKASWNLVAGDQFDPAVAPLLEDRVHGVTGAVIEKASAGSSRLTRGQALTAAFAQHQNLEGATVPVFTVSNSLPYIFQLEKGSSKQASAGEMFTRNREACAVEARSLGYNTVFI